ncbi:MAG: hypothetical protein IMZ67_02190 [Acidobacteria bacterium]|nr:hypothetical protein [Acidobacteriota bacterium]
MKFTAVGASLVAVVAVASALLAGATIWLLLTDPITVASSLHDGNVTPFVRALARAFVDACRGLLALL